jgi:hypothetical protein
MTILLIVYDWHGINPLFCVLSMNDELVKAINYGWLSHLAFILEKVRRVIIMEIGGIFLAILAGLFMDAMGVFPKNRP